MTKFNKIIYTIRLSKCLFNSGMDDCIYILFI